MSDIWIRLMDISDNHFTLLVAMAIVAALLVKELLGGLLLTIIGFPCMVLSALAGNALFVEYGIMAAPDRTLNMIVAALSGMIVGITLYVVIVQIIMKLSDQASRKPHLRRP